jgi:hypothetical protein
MVLTYGQSDAVAVELAAALNTASDADAFCLKVDAKRTFARKIEVVDIAGMNDPVTIEVIPGDDLADLVGLDQIYDDAYGCHILILQNATDNMKGGLSETQMQKLLQLRSEISEYLCCHALACPDAVHPFEGARIKACRHGKEGIYDLAKLEQNNVFYSDLIVTYRAPGLRRWNH